MSRRGQGNTTIQDVARAAGVSAMTVSRVVNGGAHVRPSTRAAVLSAIERLNYSPNTAARSLAAGQATQIGIFYSNPSAAYLSQFLVGALEGARRAGCHLVIEPCEGDSAEDLAAATKRFAETDVEGVILTAPLSDSPALAQELSASGMSIVTVAMGQPTSERRNVRIDDYAAAFEMTEHLLDLGHRDIAFIKGNPKHAASSERLRGLADALARRGLTLDPGLVENGLFTYRSGLIAAERLLTRPRLPTAIFASNDDMAAAAVSTAHRLGLSIPGEISIVGFDDTWLASTIWPALTTVRQPIGAMAETAVELLLAEIRARRFGGGGVPQEKVLEHQLIVRDSSGPVPGGIVPRGERSLAQR